MKIAFIHQMRTGGSTIDAHMRYQLAPLGYQCFNSWNPGVCERDYTVDELTEIANVSGDAYVHNHSCGWNESLVELYHSLGWRFFTFIRPTGDLLCSLYFFNRHYSKRKILLDLDDWIKQELNDPASIPCHTIVPFWEEIDDIWHFGESNIRCFFHDTFNIGIEDISYVLRTENAGFAYYCRNGEISPETKSLVLQSAAHRRYLEACRRARGSMSTTGKAC